MKTLSQSLWFFGLVLALAGPVTAQTTNEVTLLDTFNTSVPSDDVSFEVATRQSGSAAPKNYLDNSPAAALTRVTDKILRLEATGAANFVSVSPDYNFIEGGTFTIEFDLDAGTNDATSASGDWACVVFGATAPNRFVNASDGFGILYRNNGEIQVFDGGNAIYGGQGDFPSGLPRGSFHVRIEVESAGFGGGNPATIRMYVDGIQVRLSNGSLEAVKADGFRGNFITLGGSAFGGANWIHIFDNLQVSAVPCIRPSLFAVSSFVGQNNEVVTVTIPAQINRTSAVDVIITSANPAVAQPLGATAGSLVLNFPAGGATQRTFNIQAVDNGSTTFAVTGPDNVCIGGSIQVSVRGTYVRNPSFEENYNPTFPSYGPINEWTAIPGGNTGVNEAGGPFHDNSSIPDRTRIGFHQGNGGISQLINGLTAGQQYWLQFRYNKRQGGLMGLSTRFGGAEIDNIPSIPVAGANSYHFRNIIFTPTNSSGLLEFRTSATGDATALFDAVSIVARGSNQVIVQNPSFEASGIVPAPGVITPQSIAGWATTGSDVGVLVSGTGYADNGANPDQNSVLFIRNIGSISQIISNFVIGQEYRISYAVNAASGGGEINPPSFQVSMDGTSLADAEIVDPVGGTAPYLRRTNTWLATTTTAELRFEQLDDFGPPVLLIDDVRIEGLSIPPCETSVSVETFEMFGGQPIGPTHVIVGVPLYLVATSSVQVVIISLNPNVAVPTGGAGGSLTLNYPQGGATNQSFGITAVGPGTTTFIVSNLADCMSTQFTVRNRNSYIANPSFEDNSLPAFPGYGTINDWIGGSGVNTASQPFADNGGIPDRKQVAFIQGAGSLRQMIGGLVPGQSYWLQFGYNARNCCSPAVEAPLQITVRFGGVDIGTVPNVLPGGYVPRTILFTPASASGVLEFATSLPNGGDRTLLLDAVNIVARGPDDGIALNASFEGTGIVPAPGYVQPESIGGWSGGGNYGVNISGVGPFADNGRNPDQDNVAFLQDQNAFLGTPLGPLEFGASYRLSYSYNARAGNTPHLLTTLDGVVVQDTEVTPVGGSNPYLIRQFEFVATNTAPILLFAQTAAGDQTVLLDNIRLTQLTPGGLRLSITRFDATTVRVAWPAAVGNAVLQCTNNVAPAPWPEAGLPVSVEGSENAAYDTIGAGNKFYRLSQ
jgi:hypothetical protein